MIYIKQKRTTLVVFFQGHTPSLSVVTPVTATPYSKVCVCAHFKKDCFSRHTSCTFTCLPSLLYFSTLAHSLTK